MLIKSFIVQNSYGIHARPARLIVETASKFQSEILLEKNGEVINAKSIMGILMLEARKDSELILRIQGVDEGLAMGALTEVFERITTLREWENV